MKKLFFILAIGSSIAFTACKHKQDNATTGTPNSGTTGPADTTKASETGGPTGISAEGQKNSLDTNHNVKATADSAKK
jgi:hypothetical protein